jgi:TRAP-type transport system periplasmic protein
MTKDTHQQWRVKMYHLKKVILAATMAAIALPGAAMAEKKLRAGIWLPTQLVWAEPTKMFVDRVNETGKGVIQITLTGPEGIPGGEQANALRSGLLDMATLPPGLYKKEVPLANAQDISNISVKEQKENGAYAMISDMISEQLGAKLLTTYGDGTPFHIYVTKELTSLDDLKGLRLRSSSIYNDFFESLGISPTNIPAGDTYTALERGVVEGVGWPYWGVGDLGWDKFIKTRVEPGYYNVAINIMFNNDSWAALTDEERKVIDDATAWLEAELPAFVAEKDAANLAAQNEAGIVAFDAGPDFARTAEDVYWEEMLKIDAGRTGELRALFQK